jgi:hypothetical protein
MTWNAARVARRSGDIDNTDNVHMLAVLCLDVRPSSLCVIKRAPLDFELQVARHETIGRPFDFYVQRFTGVLREKFRGTAMGDINFEVKVVDALAHKFEEQVAWKLATSPVKVG